MVNKKHCFAKSAFTLIELIFAIIIISIAVMSLPMMTRITSKGIDSNLAQEAIFAASAELMGATSYYWDANSMEDNNVSHLSRVIDINSTCENNSSSPRYRLRSGHIAQPYHRRCLESNSTIAADINSLLFPNLNNAAHSSEDIFLNPTGSSSGYKDSYKSAVTVTNVNQSGAADNNIKKITISITKADTTPITVLSTYSANVGEIDYYKRRF